MKPYHPRAERRVSELAMEYAQEADSVILHNAIHDAVTDDDLALRLADVVEELQDLADRTHAIDSDLEEPLVSAIYDLTTDDEFGLSADVARARAETVVDETLGDLEDNLAEWNDLGSDAAIPEVKQEIQQIREMEDGGHDV